MNNGPPRAEHGVPDVFDDAEDGLLDPQRDPRLESHLRELSRQLCRPPDELTEHRHLAAMRVARRRQHQARLLRHVARSSAVAVVVALALASSGMLPDPLQRTVAEAATLVGITLPSPDPATPASGDDESGVDHEHEPADDRNVDPGPEGRSDEQTRPASPAPDTAVPAPDPVVPGGRTDDQAPEPAGGGQTPGRAPAPEPSLPPPPELPSPPQVPAPPPLDPPVEGANGSSAGRATQAPSPAPQHPAGPTSARPHEPASQPGGPEAGHQATAPPRHDGQANDGQANDGQARAADQAPAPPSAGAEPAAEPVEKAPSEGADPDERRP